ncbi:MAG: thiolase family protein [Ignavibacteriae bacterium]|nr:thiolase family protein [Ignavibacteriota bacterium]
MKSYHNSKKGIGIIFDDIYLSGGVRTPFGKFCGTLGKVSPTDLGIYACKGALDKTGVNPSDIHQVVVANIGQASTDAYFLPRHIALYSGIPLEVPTLMVQRICASGFETIVTASEQITLGKAENVLCCGTESMTLAPTVSFGNRMGYALGRLEFKDMLWEALDDTAAGYPMGITAENLAQKHGITRDDVDEFAKLSSDRAIMAMESGFFGDEILQMNSTKFEIEGLKTRSVRLPKGVEDFNVDENVRATSMESLKRLPSAFIKDGVQTAGNSSGIVDGSASVVVTSSSTGKEKPLAKIVAASSCGVEPKHMGIGPVPAINIILELTGLKIDDIGLFEINEAFAAQYIACEKELNIDRNRANVNGGSIAIGHPLAASGVRLALTISREMIRRKVKYGIVSACIGGGQGTAILLENCNL